MEKNSTMMKKMNVLELIEQIVEMTNDQGITTEMKRGKQQLVTPVKPYIKELMARLGIENEMDGTAGRHHDCHDKPHWFARQCL